VFNGAKAGPWAEIDPVGPLNVYGQTKLEGEQAIAASGVQHLIFRTSWVYGMRGKNFLLTMLKLGREREELKVVDDQHGAPTWSRTIADSTALALARWDGDSGIYHLSARGQTTWCGFTQAIHARAGMGCRFLPIGTADYPVPARRPANSVMDASKFEQTFGRLPAWDAALTLCMG
jgi:dTDP-4-dehydrorhamnose reductase